MHGYVYTFNPPSRTEMADDTANTIEPGEPVVLISVARREEEGVIVEQDASPSNCKFSYIIIWRPELYTYRSAPYTVCRYVAGICSSCNVA